MEENSGSKSRTCYKRPSDVIMRSLLQNLGRKMDSNLQPQYDTATLSVEASMWRIVWYNINPATNKLVRIRKTFDLNRIDSEAERRRVADERLKLLNEALANGWNYFVHTMATPNEPPAVKDITITQALFEALRIRKLGMKLRTAESYGHMTNKLQEWLTANKLQEMPVHHFTADHFQRYLESKSAAGHGNRNLNDHTNYFKTTFEVIRKKMKLIAVNPCEDFTYLPKTESSLFEPLTAEEMDRIVPVLYGYNPRFYLYTRFIAHEYIRPYHIAFIKAKDVLYGADTLKIDGSNTKSRRNSKKQLMKPIKQMLLEMGYHDLPGDYYLFGENVSTPASGTGTGKKRGQNFTYNFEPSPNVKEDLSNRAAKIWKMLVIDGLGINKKMYALKHTSSQYYVNENDKADLLFLQKHMEHSSFTQTEIYLQNKIVKRIDEGTTKTINF